MPSEAHSSRHQQQQASSSWISRSSPLTYLLSGGRGRRDADGMKVDGFSRSNLKLFAILAACIFVCMQMLMYTQLWSVSKIANKLSGDSFQAQILRRALIADDDAVAPSGISNLLNSNKEKGSNDLLNNLVKLMKSDEGDTEDDDGDNKGDTEVGDIETLPGWPNLHKGRTLIKVTDEAPPWPNYTPKEWFEMEWSYTADEKDIPYVGNKHWMKMFPNGSRQYYNSLAVFPDAVNEGKEVRYHGMLGVFPNGTRSWVQRPPVPKAEDAVGGREAAMANGGFYLNLSQTLPLDRWPPDGRDTLCLQDTFDYNELKDDVSIIITFYNEPLSTLLKSIHSVLNLTPPPLLREIIVVDDHSNLTDNLPGGPLYDYVRLLPKVKLMRLPERRGLVWARTEGIQLAKAPVIVILDSHIEVNEKWLEPQLKRIIESPKSFVFPQILSLMSDDFTYNVHSGIGCFLSFKWGIVEQATLTGKLNNTNPISSASMGGGLFAVRKDWFEEIGGYDEGFSMWGAENVETGFRTWMCGGRMECTPCALTYHIYRDGGVGYHSPSGSLTKNKMRSARAWMDEWYQVSMKFIGGEKGFDFGNIDNILEVKKRLNCKPFSWFLRNVDPNHEGQNLNDFEILGAVENKKYKKQCLDSLNHYKPNEAYGTFHCHGGGGTQGIYKVKDRSKLRIFNDETKCLGAQENLPVLRSCFDSSLADVWTLANKTRLIYKQAKPEEKCLELERIDEKYELRLNVCDGSNEGQMWQVEEFKPDPDFALPDFTIEYKKANNLI